MGSRRAGMARYFSTPATARCTRHAWWRRWRAARQRRHQACRVHLAVAGVEKYLAIPARREPILGQQLRRLLYLAGLLRTRGADRAARAHVTDVGVAGRLDLAIVVLDGEPPHLSRMRTAVRT